MLTRDSIRAAYAIERYPRRSIAARVRRFFRDLWRFLVAPHPEL